IVRRLVREEGEAVTKERLDREEIQRRTAEWAMKEEAREDEIARRARCVVVPEPRSGPPRSLAMLDLPSGLFKLCTGDELPDAARFLARYDMLIGPGVRETVRALGLEVDARPLI